MLRKLKWPYFLLHLVLLKQTLLCYLLQWVRAWNLGLSVTLASSLALLRLPSSRQKLKKWWRRGCDSFRGYQTDIPINSSWRKPTPG